MEPGAIVDHQTHGHHQVNEGDGVEVQIPKHDVAQPQNQSKSVKTIPFEAPQITKDEHTKI